MNIVLLCAVLVTAAISLKIPCPASKDGFYDPKRQLCCDFGTTERRNENGDELDCCYNSTFVRSSHICCGIQILDKYVRNGVERKCCGVHTYIPSDNTQVRCRTTLHNLQNQTTKSTACCGEELINPQSRTCCKDGNGNTKSHNTESKHKCCKADYYNKKTHHCFRNKYVLPRYIELCNNHTYNTRKEKCCGKTLYNVSKSPQLYQCCGDLLYNITDNKCCARDEPFLIPRDAECCKNTSYYKDKERCCTGVPVPFSIYTEECCGTTLYDTWTQGCCGKTSYNKSTSECCQPNGDIIEKDSDQKCCGPHKYDSVRQVCCTQEDDFHNVLHSTIAKTDHQSTHDRCCATHNLQVKHSYSGETHSCLLNGTIIPRADRCGYELYNESKDLCCVGTLNKNAREMGGDCCGTKPFNQKTHICCDNMVFEKIVRKSCEAKEISDPPYNDDQDYGICSYCNGSESASINHLTQNKKICKQNALKIKVINQTRYSDSVVLTGVLHRNVLVRGTYRKRSRSIRVPCSCKFYTKTAILVTDLEDFSKPIRLGDVDILLPWSRKLTNRLRKQWGQCKDKRSMLAEKFVCAIRLFVDFIESRLKKNTIGRHL